MTKDLIVLDDTNFDTEIGRADGGPILVDFWATWCGPCRIVAPVIEALAEEMKGVARFGKVDVDQNPATAAKFGIQSIPTLMVFKEGKAVDKIIGAAAKDAIVAMVQRHV